MSNPSHESTSNAHVENAVEREIPKLRYIFILPIVASFVAAVVLMIFGFVETFKVIIEAVSHGDGHAMEILRLHFIEIIDVFLLATILYVIASGFYQLFLGRPLAIVPWMKVNSVHDLEVMLIGVTITVLGVSGLSAVLSWDGQSALWQIGVAIALIIAALAYFLGRSSH